MIVDRVHTAFVQTDRIKRRAFRVRNDAAGPAVSKRGATVAKDPYKSAWRCGPLPYEKYRVLVRDIGTMWCQPCMQKRLHPSALEIRYLPTRCRRCRRLRARFRKEVAEPMSQMSHSDLTLEALGGDPVRRRLASELLKMYAP